MDGLTDRRGKRAKAKTIHPRVCMCIYIYTARKSPLTVIRRSRGSGVSGSSGGGGGLDPELRAAGDAREEEPAQGRGQVFGLLRFVVKGCWVGWRVN